MIRYTLNRTDCIESFLPMVEQAMESGEVCQIDNINYLGPLETAALILLVMAESLRDTCTGKIYRAHAGFRLVGIDDHGISRTLVR